MVNDAKTILQRGMEVSEQIDILGDDGVPIDYHLKLWKSEIIDFVILQQDAFDQIDMLTPLERQQYMLEKVMAICNLEFTFDAFIEVPGYFKRIINTLRQMNYSGFGSEKFKGYENELTNILKERELV